MANTLKIKFELEAGFLCRDSIRQELQNSKAKLNIGILNVVY